MNYELLIYEGWLKCQPSFNKMKVNKRKVTFFLVYFQKTSSILKVRVKIGDLLSNLKIERKCLKIYKFIVFV